MGTKISHKCKHCGKCCSEEGYVIFTRKEADLLLSHCRSRDHIYDDEIIDTFEDLGITGKNQDEASIVVFIVGKGESCPFLYSNKCIVYDFRPKRCRTFPFWPEYFTTDDKFDMKGRGCPGVSIKEE
jgi:uncharacterized protein